MSGFPVKMKVISHWSEITTLSNELLFSLEFNVKAREFAADEI